MEEQPNEFGTPENDVQQDFSGVNLEDEPAPTQDVMDDDIEVAAPQGGKVYDYTKGPDYTKAPDRIDLTGKTVTIKKAELILPPAHIPWQKTRSGDNEFKAVKFELWYDEQGQRETLSGVRSFKQVREGKEILGIPTIYKEGNSQASTLMKRYAEFKGKSVAEVSLKEFMAYLNSHPKVEIKGLPVQNPQTGQTITKNLPLKFV